MTTNPPFDPSHLTVRQLLAAYVSILTELLARGLIRTCNSPLGDLVEHIVWRAYGGELAPNSARSYDLIDADGRKLQVKARTIGANGGGSTIFSAIRSWDFDVVVFVTLGTESYDVVWARELTADEAEGLARRREHTNSSAIRVRTVPDYGVDVTERIRAAYAELDTPTP